MKIIKQPKHKSFFWLLLQNRLNTRGTMRRRNVFFESYTCDMYIVQKEETLRHLFIQCNFARNCWNSIGINIPRHLTLKQLIRWLRRKLQVPFHMDAIILMSWSICTTRKKMDFLANRPHNGKHKDQIL